MKKTVFKIENGSLARMRDNYSDEMKRGAIIPFKVWDDLGPETLTIKLVKVTQVRDKKDTWQFQGKVEEYKGKPHEVCQGLYSPTTHTGQISFAGL